MAGVHLQYDFEYANRGVSATFFVGRAVAIIAEQA
jgi:hypothetical protein